MPRPNIVLLTAGLVLLLTSVATAQYPVVNAQDVRARMSAKKKCLLVDTRSAEEYREAHISGAINIPAEQMRTHARLLPKDKASPIIFYCRGEG